VITASPQNQSSKPFFFNMLLAAPTTTALRRLTTPLCWGEYDAVNCLLTPSYTQYSANCFEVNSLPLSVRNIDNLCPDSPSARAWNSVMDATT
jgi:hypothetical protein